MDMTESWQRTPTRPSRHGHATDNSQVEEHRNLFGYKGKGKQTKKERQEANSKLCLYLYT